MFAEMTEAVPKPPRRMRITQFYSKLYYNTRIKPVFDAEWAAKTSNASRITILNNVTTRLWEAEPQSFKIWLEGQRDADHQRELEDHQRLVKAMEQAPDSAESYHSALSRAAIYLQPFADLMAKKFGAAVSILMVCPVGTSQGEIELRSVHSGTTKEAIPRTWPAFDRAGFDMVQQSMVNFGKHVFSTSEMEARSLGPRDSTASASIPHLSSNPTREESIQPFSSEVPLCTNLGPQEFLPPAAASHDESSAPPKTFRSNQLPSLTRINFRDEPPLSSGTSRRNEPPSPARIHSSVEPPLSPGTAVRKEVSPFPETSDHNESPSPTRAHSRDEHLFLETIARDESSPPGISHRDHLSPPRNTPLPDESSLLPSTLRNESPLPADTPSLGEPLSTSPSEKSLASPQHASHPLPPSELQDQLLILDDVPASYKATYEAVLRGASKWGAMWADCVTAFVVFEKTAGFGFQDARLPSLPSRPSQMSEWFKHGRKLSGQVWDGFCAGDPDAFGERWGKWWSDLQPEGRRRNDGGMYLQDNADVDWDCLRKPGGSGFFLILVALVWWREMIEARGLQPLRTKDWEDSVKDVKWVLDCLINGWKPTGKDNVFSSTQKKRKAAASERVPLKKTRARR